MLQNEDTRNSLVYSLAFSHESDWLPSVQNDRMHQQLQVSRNQLRAPARVVDKDPLPQTLEDALRPSSRAIVITEPRAPFGIWNVNRAWEDLCGYSYVESRGKTLGSLLKGPETNTLAATALIGQLLQGESAGTVLINYTKDGRRFCNRVRVGPLRDPQTQAITHFVGILQAV
jgi:PAS domain S-box-containing protein